VQFHWDRYGKADENSSCWVRVAQVWSGKTWGAIHIPRIGQEVIVEFLEGDPDQPIITGRVYNADQMPPYDLPANRTQSGIKSRSSLKGTTDNFNEIRFEDKKGEEQLFIHAEKNQDIEVENDETHTVGHDRTKDVGNDETTTIGKNRTEKVGEDESITIAGNRTESVGKDESISIDGNRTENVGKNESITIGKNRTENVGKDETISIGGNRTEDVAKNEKVTVGEERQHSVGKNDTLEVGKKLGAKAGDEISLQCGDASITLKKNGEIVIKGKDIKLDGSGKVDVKAASDLTLKGSSIKEN
jgi:type VI secretion system secreted protein VgrG